MSDKPTVSERKAVVLSLGGVVVRIARDGVVL